MGGRPTREVARDIYAITAKRKRARMEGLLKELARTLHSDEEPEEQEYPAETLADLEKAVGLLRMFDGSGDGVCPVCSYPVDECSGATWTCKGKLVRSFTRTQA